MLAIWCDPDLLLQEQVHQVGLPCGQQLRELDGLQLHRAVAGVANTADQLGDAA